MSNNLGANFEIDVTDLKAGLAQANRLIRESESEFREAAAGMDDWSSSSEGLTKRSKTLNDQIALQQKKVEALTKAKQEVIDKMKAEGKTQEQIGRAVDDFNKKIANESKQLDRLKSDLNKTEKSLDDMGDATEDAGRDFSGLKTAGGIAAGAVAAVVAAAAAGVGALLGLAESTRESRTAMAKLETAFANVGMSAKAAENTFSSLYGVLGDEGTATEAAQQIAQYANSVSELEGQTRILTGVFATYGDSIDAASLAEGIASTIAMGEVQGTLADALEWQGVNLDNFNAKLATLKTEQEREAYITETLNGLYGEAADKYREANAEIIAANKATADLNNAMNGLGAIAEPVMTTLKTVAAGLVESITPSVGLIGEGLSGAFSGSADAASNLSAGISGVVETVVSTVANMLPTLAGVISELIPELLSMLAGQLPTILTALVDAVTLIIESLSDALPRVLEVVVGLIPLLLETIAGALPQIITAITSLIPEIIKVVVGAVPQLISAAITLLMAIVQAIPQIVVALAEALPSIVTAIVNALLTGIPILINGAVKLLFAIIDAIPVILEALGGAIPSIISTIIDLFINGYPMLVSGAIQLLMAVIEAIPTIIKALYGQIPQIVLSIVQTLVKRAPDVLKAAREIWWKILAAIPALITELGRKVPEIVKTIISIIKNYVGKMKEIGKDLLMGLWEGIGDTVDFVVEKVKGVGGKIMDGLKDFFGIKSPSRLMADVVGKNLGLGIGVGFEKSMKGVAADMNAALDEAVPEVELNANVPKKGLASGRSGVVINQTNNYSQSHSRYEIYKSKQQTAAAVRLALGGA